MQDQWEIFKRSQAEESGSSHLVNLGSNRYDFWRVSLSGFEEHPLAGIGGRGFGPRYLQYGDSYETPARAHSLPLDALLETGLVGLILLLAAFAAILAGVAIRLSTAAGAAAFGALVYFAVHAAGDWVWTFPAVGLPLFALVGIALAPVGGRVLTGRTAAIAAAAVAIFAVVAFLPPWLSSRVTSSVLTGAAEVGSLRWARALDPLAVEPYLAEAAVASRPVRGDPTARARRREGASRRRSPVSARQGVPRGGTGRGRPRSARRRERALSRRRGHPRGSRGSSARGRVIAADRTIMSGLATPRPENLSPAGRAAPDPPLPFGGERGGVAGYVQALREHWLLVATLVVLAVGTAAAYSYTAAKRYEADASLIVTPLSASDSVFLGTSALREGGVQSNGVLTAARLIQTPETAQAAAERLGDGTSASELLASIEVSPVSQSSLVTIRGKADTPERAAAIANAFAVAIVARRTELLQNDIDASIDRLESRLDEIAGEDSSDAEARAIQQKLSTLRPLVGAEDPTLRIASRAVPPDVAAWPRPKLSHRRRAAGGAPARLAARRSPPS